MTVFDTALAEARRLGHNHVGTEHLLLGLIRHRSSFPTPSAHCLATPASWPPRSPAASTSRRHATLSC